MSTEDVQVHPIDTISTVDSDQGGAITEDLAYHES